MKEIYMLAGVGLGMVAGVMLYKYCDNAKKIVDNTEKKIISSAQSIEKDLSKKMDKKLKKKD